MSHQALEATEYRSDLARLGTLCNQLRVHRARASSVHAQFTILNAAAFTTRSHSRRELQEILNNLYGTLHAAIPSLSVNSPQSPLSEFDVSNASSVVQSSGYELDWYLAEGGIIKAIDMAHKAILNIMAKCSLDERTDDQLACEQTKYSSASRDMDQLDLNLLLRNCLRDKTIFSRLQSKQPSEVKAFFYAVQLAKSGSRSSDSQLFEYWLSKWENTGKTGALHGIEEIPDLAGQVTLTELSPSINGLTEIRKGKMDGTSVAVYLPRVSLNAGTVPKRALEWARCNHPNVLKLNGSCRDLSTQGDVALICPWMNKGTLMSYLLDNPAVDRLKLVTGIINGLHYLHTRSPPIIHANLTKNNIFINDQDVAIIGGLEWRVFANDNDETDERLIMQTYPYVRQEVDLEAVEATSADIAALGIIIYEVFVGHFPAEVAVKLSRGDLPERPNALDRHRVLGDDIWDLLQTCWGFGERTRPTAFDLLETLRLSQRLPPLNVPNLTSDVVLSDDSLVLAGGFGEVRQGHLQSTKVAIAIKSFLHRGSIKGRLIRLTKRFRREVVIWSQLNYQNILPFWGIAEIPGLSTVLIAPWIDGGDCIKFLKNHPNQARLPIICGIIRGLASLHSHTPEPVVHADLKGANILMTPEGEPMLADFGLALIVNDLDDLPISTALREAGTARWMAPELLMTADEAPELLSGASVAVELAKADEVHASQESDIWAFGMVMLEIMTLDRPFREILGRSDVPFFLALLMHKKRPERPSADDSPELSDDLWDLCHQCWRQAPAERPTAIEVLKEIEGLLEV